MLLAACFFSFFTHANAAQNASPSTSNINLSDVVGKFADVGYVGPYAETKTVDQAHEICLSLLGTGESAAVTTNDAFNDFYKKCMSDYVPFKTVGTGSLNQCLGKTVSWGKCESFVGSTADGQILSVKNTTDGFEGYAQFSCSSGALQYLSGACSAVADDCEEGSIAEWPVTSPLWADSSSATVYVDKYGENRSIPKASCKASMPKSQSGQLINAVPSSSMMPADQSYDMASSNSAQRCFNSKWQYDPTAGGSSCTYVPKSCKAQTLAHNGCSFTIPEIPHDTIYSNASPSPFMSSGSMEVYCFDGEIEIKQASCQVSCSNSIPATTWSGSDPKSCRHDIYPTPLPVAPGVKILVPNVEAGMSGSISYTCQNGTLVQKDSTCEPKSCDHINAKNWGQCSHQSITGITWKHGDTYQVDSATNVFTSTGTVSYQCVYGGLSSGEDGSMDMIGSPSCQDTQPPQCDANPTTPPSTCVGGVQVGNVCCLIGSDGTPQCSTFDPPDATSSIEYGAWGPYSEIGDEYNCSGWSPSESSQPSGWTYTATSICEQQEQRSRTVFKVWSTGQRDKLPDENETRVVQKPKYQDFIGTSGDSSVFNLSFQKSNWVMTQPNAGTYSQFGDLIVLKVNGYLPTGTTVVGGDTRLIWNNPGCQGCYVSLSEVSLTGLDITPPEYHASYGTSTELVFTVEESSQTNYGIGFKVFPSNTGAKPSLDTRFATGTLIIPVHLGAKTVNITSSGVISRGEMVCQVDTWHGC